MDELNQPGRWFEALALCEYAIEIQPNSPLTEDFFLEIFRSYDCNASSALDDQGNNLYPAF